MYKRQGTYHTLGAKARSETGKDPYTGRDSRLLCTGGIHEQKAGGAKEAQNASGTRVSGSGEQAGLASGLSLIHI